MSALLAALDVPAERRRAAALDRRHHLQLVEADVSGIGSTPRRPVVAEDIRDLQRWTEHRGRLRRRGFDHTLTQRGDSLGCHGQLRS
jgi:hypothetical protein